jgi:hypothetical protein
MTDQDPINYLFENHGETLYLNALSKGLSAEDRIQIQGKIGLIHSVFQRVINISVSEKQLISIVDQEVGHGPLNILVNIPTSTNLTTIGIKMGDIVTRAGELIILGDNMVVISTEWAKLWEPRLNFQHSLQSLKTIMTNIEILKDVVLASDHLNGLGELISFTQFKGFKVTKTKKLGPVAQFASPHITSLLNAIKSGHSSDIIQIIKNIVGLGPGLTPAADDMLLGLMISMIYISENFTEISFDINKINKDIVSPISGRTTIISEEFLREASIGNVNEPIASLMENLLTSDQKEVVASVKKVLTLGSTSGADTVFGIILGMNLLLSSLRN